jgi:hypothetical protein
LSRGDYDERVMRLRRRMIVVVVCEGCKGGNVSACFQRLASACMLGKNNAATA